MRLKVKIVISTLLMLVMTMMFSVTALADSVDDVGGTGQGNIGGTNVYTFSYIYDASADAIKLKVDTTKNVSSFGNTNTYTFNSPDDNLTLHTKNPRLGNSLENAVASMNAAGGYNLSVDYVKSALNSHGYYDKGNGIWICDGGYLTYISAVKVRPKVHTVTYNANGGSGAPGNQTKSQGVTLTLSSTKPTRTGYTFKYWNASIGGTYNPGGSYTHDQDGGTVTMTAKWADETKPSCSSFSAIPNSWSSGNGTVSFSAQDKGSGMASIKLQRYSYVSNSWSDIKTWTYSGTTGVVSETYTETAEGVFYYKLTLTDKAGNVNEKTSAVIYLDHSNPVISGHTNTTTVWTKTAPTINVSATDYLSGTSYAGSGVKSIVIKKADGTTVASGTTSTSYTLKAGDEGTRTWTIVATDNVGHTSTVTVTTRYDISGPNCSIFSAVPNSWSNGNGTVTIKATDSYSGISSIVLKRYSYVTKQWSTIKSWTGINSTSEVTKTYTQTAEGVYMYQVILTDNVGNTTTKNSAVIYLDHTKPVINGVEDTVTGWTNRAPIISVSATDYLSGTTYNGSGLKSLVIKNDSGTVVARGTTSVSYTLKASDEGIHTWTIVATDNVGYTTTNTVTTKYDITVPGIDGTETTLVHNGETYSGYCEDNIIDQTIDDKAWRSSNNPNCTSGLKSVILYRVVGTEKTVIYGSTTKATFSASDTNSSFDMYYEISADEKDAAYYWIVVSDHAGNVAKKKLISQYSLLTWFHTSIERSTYR